MNYTILVLYTLAVVYSQVYRKVHYTNLVLYKLAVVYSPVYHWSKFNKAFSSNLKEQECPYRRGGRLFRIFGIKELVAKFLGLRGGT